jgi:hypothetical protein
VAILGLASRYDWVALPPQYRVFDHDWIIGAAVVLYVVEFFADKIPWVDSAWDAIHTIIRPIGGALIAVASIGHASPATQTFVALAGAALASSTHLTKAGTRAVVNTSPEPFSNWILSLAEDGFAIGLGLLALRYPLAAAVVAIVCLAAIVSLGRSLFRALRRRISGRGTARPPSARTARRA